ncbi:MAG: MATE family efflux transporter [Blautia sp.]|nr:MATE family efflux transporter [Blautia sp.]MCM1201805.1 MATE family efflux transporter [Bacteroides fragilis]
MTNDMTKGAILPMLIKFTIPLVLGNLLQLTYNAIDGIIVGQYVGKEALAAVGTSNPLVTLMILFLQGICLGAGILIGTLYGAKNYETLKRQISTAMMAGTGFSLALTAAALVSAPALLSILQVDAAIRGEAAVYLRIIMCGLVFNFIYNFFASTLRAMGDGRSPLYFLGISAFVNIVGDLVFVIAFSMGTVGCAVSTVLSEALSCLLCWLYIRKNIAFMNLGKQWFRFDKKLLKQTIQYGFVSAMQQATVQLGKLCIQGTVNTMGVTSTAAFAAINRIDDYAYIPEQNIGHAMTGVMAQNRGAGEKKRVKDAFRIGMYVEFAYGAAAGGVLLLLANPLMRLFTRDEATVLMGERYLHLIAFMYIVPAVTNGVQGYFRGMGDLAVTLWSSLINMGVRVIVCLLLVFVCKMGILALPWAYLAGWGAMMLYELPFLLHRLRIPEAGERNEGV